jgi:DNA replication protein DnaC
MKPIKKLVVSALVIAIYIVIMITPQSFAFGQYQIRIATALYSLSYIYPFLIVPLGLANLLSNTIMGGLGPFDMFGGMAAGLVTASVVYLVKRFKLNEWIIAHYLGSLRRNRQPSQTPAYFLDVNAFQTDYNLATMMNDEAAMAKIKSTILQAQAAPFAVLDDIGVRSASEAFRAYVHAIINYRTANGLPTVFTSNLPIEEMAQVFDARLYDRMRDMCAVLHFGGESKRGRR